MKKQNHKCSKCKRNGHNKTSCGYSTISTPKAITIVTKTSIKPPLVKTSPKTINSYDKTIKLLAAKANTLAVQSRTSLTQTHEARLLRENILEAQREPNEKYVLNVFESEKWTEYETENFKNIEVSPRAFARMSAHWHPYVQGWVAEHSKCPPEILAEIASDDNMWEVNQGLALANPNCPPETLVKAYEDHPMAYFGDYNNHHLAITALNNPNFPLGLKQYYIQREAVEGKDFDYTDYNASGNNEGYFNDEAPAI